MLLRFRIRTARAFRVSLCQHRKPFSSYSPDSEEVANVVSIIAILGAIPLVVNAVEAVLGAFPGSGSIKKNVVLNSINSLVTEANALGAKIDAAFVSATASTLIDDYVETQNALGTKGFAAAQAALDNKVA